MTTSTKSQFLEGLSRRFAKLEKLDRSLSLFEIGDGVATIYVRYSKLHAGGRRTFYGLRRDDLRRLEGRNSYVVFLWDGQREPLFVRYAEYEPIFSELTPASDGQFKAQVYLDKDSTDLYVANAGRYNVESGFGWNVIEQATKLTPVDKLPPLSHPQVQTLLGSIGARKGYDVWIPPNDRPQLDWDLTPKFRLQKDIVGFDSILPVIEEVDVIWVARGSKRLQALFEVEHSTPIYSGLLRFNDVHLAASDTATRYSIVAEESRRALFSRQLRRPTFKSSGLVEVCTFLDYQSVHSWFHRLVEPRSHTVKSSSK
jgi:hypothetical protein